MLLTALARRRMMGPAGLIAAFMQEEHEIDERQRVVEEAEAETAMEKVPVSHTLDEISEGTGLTHEEVKEAMRDDEDELFSHLPHPDAPTRYMLAVHAHDATEWQPGVDF